MKKAFAPLIADNNTATNVPLAVKVWIVSEPSVVIVPPVESVVIPSLPSVAYRIITIPSFPFG